MSVKSVARTLAVMAFVAALSGCKVYQSIGKSTGAFLDPVSGTPFVHIENSKWDSQDNALIYFYRPHSDWGAEEIESPSLYVDDQQYFNFRDNSYTWLEVHPGTRHISMRRPLLGLEGLGGFSLSKFVDADFDVEPGKIYYLRYSETTTPDEANPDLAADSPWGKGDLQLVTPDYAYKEIVNTRFLKADPLAPNHAGTSIVDDNVRSEFAAREAAIKKEREEQLAQLKASGQYSSGAWWCLYLCGGGEPVLTADAKQQDLDKDIHSYEMKIAQEQPETSWWPF